MNIDKITDELVAMLEANAAGRITHRDAWRKATHTRLVNQGEDAIRAQHAKLTGEGTNSGKSSGENYHIRPVDHAISAAIHILERVDHDGNRTFSDETIWEMLVDEHGQAISSRAIQAALDGAYKIDLGHAVHRAVDQVKWNPITLDEYRTIMGDAMPDLPAADEDIGW